LLFLTSTIYLTSIAEPVDDFFLLPVQIFSLFCHALFASNEVPDLVWQVLFAIWQFDGGCQ
jgi:hypothetical protein